MVGNEKTRATKGRFLTLKITSRNGLNPTSVFVWKTEYFSRGFEQNSRQGMKLVSTVGSLNIVCHLNIEQGKFYVVILLFIYCVCEFYL